MRRIPSIVGRKFGLLTVLEEIEQMADYARMVRCRCDCGAIVDRRFNTVRLNGASNNCGCRTRKELIQRNKKHALHGKSNTPEFRIWTRMISRCTNKNDKQYNAYGGRGICICNKWLISFSSFIADMGERPTKKHSIDRINNNGNYEPTNCRWATMTQQSRNRRSSHYITINGETKTLTEMAIKYGINPNSVWTRLRLGWPPVLAVTKPARFRSPNHKSNHAQ